MVTRSIAARILGIVDIDPTPAAEATEATPSTESPSSYSPHRNPAPHSLPARPNGDGQSRTSNFSRASAGSIISSALNTADPHAEFVDQIKQWAQVGPSENQPQRIRAMELILLAYRHSAETLDLGGLALTSLPDLTGLSSLRSLHLGTNRLSGLRSLPPSLQHLDISNNHFSDLNSVPRSLRLLNTENNPQFGFVPRQDEAIRRYRDFMPVTALSALPVARGGDDHPATGGQIFFRTIHAADVDFRSNALFQVKLDEWVDASTGVQTSARIEAARRITESKNNREPELFLTGLDLGSLPECLSAMNHLRKLEVVDCNLQNISNLPASLNILDASRNCLDNSLDLTNLIKLEELYLNRAQIFGLDHIPLSVKVLDLGFNELSHLPSLPVNLVSTERHLNQIDVSNNSWDIQAIHQIEALANRIQVHFLDSEAATSSAMEAAESAALVDAILQSYFETEFTEATPGFKLDDGASHTSNDMVRNFMEWHAESASITPDSEAAWGKIAAEPNAKFFSGFLVELSETAEYQKRESRPAMKKIVGELMDELFKSPQFREICFTVAMDASASCHDRIALSLNEMKLAKISHDAEQGKYSNKELSDLGRVMYRLKLVDDIVERTTTEQLKKYADNPVSQNKVDPIEIRLAFQVALANIVKMPGVTREMRYFASANITDDEIDAAAAEISRLDSGNNYVEFLLHWTPWQKAMQLANKDRFAVILARIEEDRDWLVFPLKALNSGDYNVEGKKEQTHIASAMERFMAHSTWKFLSE